MARYRTYWSFESSSDFFNNAINSVGIVLHLAQKDFGECKRYPMEKETRIGCKRLKKTHSFNSLEVTSEITSLGLGPKIEEIN